jgi:mRNA interferase MazF
MKRGDIFRVYKGNKNDPKKDRLFIIVSRQKIIDIGFSSVICAPMYSSFHGLSTQVQLDIEDGVKKKCSIHCDELVSLPKSKLTNFVCTLPDSKLHKLNTALMISIGLK